MKPSSTRQRFVLLAAVCALGLAAGGVARAWRSESGHPVRVFSAGELPDDRRLGPLRDLDSHCPFTPPASLQAWQDRASTPATPAPRRTRPLALADANTAQRPDHRHRRTRRLHRRESGVGKPAGTLRDWQCVPAEVRRTARRCAHRARPLARRPFRGSGRRRGCDIAVDGCRALRVGRALPHAGARGPLGAFRRRHVPLRHGGLRRQRADSTLRRARVREAASVRIRIRFVAVLFAAGGAAPAEHHGFAGLERDPCARLPRRTRRRGSETHRGDRRERRRHADVHPRCARRSPCRDLSGGDGRDAHARWLHL